MEQRLELSMLHQVRYYLQFEKIKRLERGVSEEMLASVKAGYIGRFVMQIENLKLLLVTAINHKVYLLISTKTILKTSVP
jgi:hypothetical protein